MSRVEARFRVRRGAARRLIRRGMQLLSPSGEPRLPGKTNVRHMWSEFKSEDDAHQAQAATYITVPTVHTARCTRGIVAVKILFVKRVALFLLLVRIPLVFGQSPQVAAEAMTAEKAGNYAQAATLWQLSGEESSHRRSRLRPPRLQPVAYRELRRSLRRLHAGLPPCNRPCPASP